MVQRFNLNKPPAQSLAEIVKQINERAQSSKTGAHGVKDMGTEGDSVWTRPDGTVHSVREIEEVMDQTRAELAEAIDNLEVLTGTTLPELQDKLGGLAELEDVQAILGDLERIEGEVQEAGRLYTAGPPPADPVVGATLWVAPNGRVFRAVECKE